MRNDAMDVLGWLAVMCLLFTVIGCGSAGSDDATDSAAASVGVPAQGPWTAGVSLPAEPQFQGDPVRGRDTLLNGAYMSCGLPY